MTMGLCTQEGAGAEADGRGQAGPIGGGPGVGTQAAEAPYGDEAPGPPGRELLPSSEPGNPPHRLARLGRGQPPEKLQWTRKRSKYRQRRAK